MADGSPYDRRLSNFFDIHENNTITLNRGNPLSSKITSALSTSYADSDIKDALNLIDNQGLKNTPVTRRQFRYDIQKEVIESNGEIIDGLGHVAGQLKEIGVTIKKLNQEFQELKHLISAAHQETAPALQEASVLLIQKGQVETKEHLLNAFNSHFIMSDDEVAILTSTSEPVDDNFFLIFSRAKKIQKDCEILLGTENQRLGLEIMEQVSKNLNAAFQKLYKWIQREFKYLNLENPQITSSIRRALRVLAERPSLFHSSLDFFAETRENVLTNSFYSALSGSSVLGDQDVSVKPIELVAHDPLRYVGDMLAWTHSATVSEREALEVLFISDGAEIAKGIQAGRKSEPWSQLSEDEEKCSDFDGLRALNELVDRDFNGVTSVLRQRIGQLVQSHEETITAYKIVNLLNFYRVTFSKLLDDGSELVNSLSNLEESAFRQFRMLMKDHVMNIHTDAQVAPENCEPPEFLYEGLKQITDIMKTYESSFASINSREADFQPILEDAFDPFMSRCEEIAKDLTTPYDSLFYMNCLLTAKKSLSPFSFTEKRLSLIQSKIEMCTASLVKYQYAYLQENTGLQPLVIALDSLSCSESDLMVMRSLESLKPDALKSVSEKLDSFLPSALIDAIENLGFLQDSGLARKITEEAIEKFCNNFEQVEQKLIALDNYTWNNVTENEEEKLLLRDIFPRTSGEIRVLLS